MRQVNGAEIDELVENHIGNGPNEVVELQVQPGDPTEATVLSINWSVAWDRPQATPCHEALKATGHGSLPATSQLFGPPGCSMSSSGAYCDSDQEAPLVAS